MLLLITASVTPHIFTKYREDADGSCTCVVRRRRFRPGQLFVVREEMEDGLTFRLAGVGYLSLPRRAFVLCRCRRRLGGSPSVN